MFLDTSFKFTSTNFEFWAESAHRVCQSFDNDELMRVKLLNQSA